ncbi:MAG: hypothetical protein HY784_06445 [Chloroflexi bacterium]|nr:hypothetical protein [Chloroflexota bacterium]
MHTGPAGPAAEPEAPAKAAPRFAPRARPRTETFNPDYTHIKNDLRRIGMLAGGLLAVLVLLSFFIR